jgi:hypothetical protein
MTAPAKPLYGDPCNGCGLCCLEAQCPLSEIMFGVRERCPALEELPAGGYGCGLASSPERYTPMAPAMRPVAREAFALLIGAGSGCDGSATAADRLVEDARRPALFARAQAAVDSATPNARQLLNFIRGPGRISRSPR